MRMRTRSSNCCFRSIRACSWTDDQSEKNLHCDSLPCGDDRDQSSSSKKRKTSWNSKSQSWSYWSSICGGCCRACGACGFQNWNGGCKNLKTSVRCWTETQTPPGSGSRWKIGQKRHSGCVRRGHESLRGSSCDSCFCDPPRTSCSSCGGGWSAFFE